MNEVLLYQVPIEVPLHQVLMHEVPLYQVPMEQMPVPPEGTSLEPGLTPTP